jgi:hypothetical protein
VLNLRGSGDISLAVAAINRLYVTLQGSGSITIGNKVDIHTLDIKLTGSGDITLNDSTVDSMACTLVGSGDIKDFIILGEGRLAVTGSGNIRGEANRNARIKEARTGSGKIRVNRLCK